MLAYAASRPVTGKRPSSPPAMLLIISAHVALIALAMSAKIEIDRRHKPDGPTIYVPPAPPPPPPNGTAAKRTTQTDDQQITHTSTTTELPPVGGESLGTDEQPSGGDVALGGGGLPLPPLPTPLPVRHEARLLTPLDQLKPPYPELKALSGEEAKLQLRLTISDSGRVTSVEPIGAADRVFLDAARRYLIAHWRYSPATEDGRAVNSTVVISLRFQLDG
jgi:protein TonB